MNGLIEPPNIAQRLEHLALRMTNLCATSRRIADWTDEIRELAELTRGLVNTFPRTEPSVDREALGHR